MAVSRLPIRLFWGFACGPDESLQITFGVWRNWWDYWRLLPEQWPDEEARELYKPSVSWKLRIGSFFGR